MVKASWLFPLILSGEIQFRLDLAVGVPAVAVGDDQYPPLFHLLVPFGNPEDERSLHRF